MCCHFIGGWRVKNTRLSCGECTILTFFPQPGHLFLILNLTMFCLSYSWIAPNVFHCKRVYSVLNWCDHFDFGSVFQVSLTCNGLVWKHVSAIYLKNYAVLFPGIKKSLRKKISQKEKIFFYVVLSAYKMYLFISEDTRTNDKRHFRGRKTRTEFTWFM